MFGNSFLVTSSVAHFRGSSVVRLTDELLLHFWGNLKYEKFKHYLFLGIAEQGDSNQPCINEFLNVDNEYSDEVFINSTMSWVGRWVVISSSGHIYSDFWNSIPLNISYLNDSFYCSNSSLVMTELLASMPSARVNVGSIRLDVKPYSYYSIFRKESVQCKISSFNTHLAFDDALEVFDSHISTAVKRLSASGNRFKLPLTGGRDSRTILATFMKVKNLNFETFTFSKPILNLSFADFLVPFLFSFIFGFKHALVKSLSVRNFEGLKLLASTFRELQSNKLPGSIYYYVFRGQYERVRDDSIYCSGLYFDLIQGTYANYFRDRIWFSSIGINLTITEFESCLMEAEELFRVERKVVLEKGLYYWSIRKNGLSINHEALSILGLNVFCPGICLKSSLIIVNSLSSKELSNSKLQKQFILKSNRILGLFPFNFLGKDLDLYIRVFFRKISQLYTKLKTNPYEKL